MLVEIKKTEMIDVKLDKVLYVNFCESTYYRFTPVKDKIEVLTFSESDIIGFCLSSREELYSHEIPILNLSAEYTKEITADEFDLKLQDLLLHYI